MPEWIPTERSAKGRLTLRAFDAFASDDFDTVNVVALCADAGVTTGTLYHHFGNKLGLYEVVRSEVERRLLDRMEGALAAMPVGSPALASTSTRAALLIGFDYVAGAGFARLLCVEHPGSVVDPIQKWLSGVLDAGVVPIAQVLIAAWRRALRAVADGIEPKAARAAIERLTFTL
ncbi:MAG: TetR/AcrR family transcriptional regulator [Ilumatobacteraceae bacterium]